jgi:hypothetical protein
VAENREGLPYFRAHLEGKVSFLGVVRPEKGKKLQTLLSKIQWQD